MGPFEKNFIGELGRKNVSIGKLGSSRKKFIRELGFSFIGELGTSGKNFVVELGPKTLSIIGELGTFILEKTS